LVHWIHHEGVRGDVGARFEPGFVMIDGYIAQCNACVTELPHSIELMCWFHITKIVWAKAAEFKVSAKDSSAGN